MKETSGGRGVLRAFVFVPLATLIYALVLHSVYAELLVEHFGYMGYLYEAASWNVMAVAWLIATLVALLLPRWPQGPSSVVLWILYIVVVAPCVLVLPYMGTLGAWESVEFGAGLGAAFGLVITITRRGGLPPALSLKMLTSLFWPLISLLSALTYLYVAFTTGLSFQYLAILDVYDQRADYREALTESTLLGYLVSNQANVINPLLIAWGVYKRWWLLSVLGIIGQILLYGSTGFKSILFSVLAIFVILVIFRVSGRVRLLLLLWGAGALIAFAAIVDHFYGSIVLTSIFTRRFLFTPSRLSGLYVDWYSTNPFSFMGNSILSPFVQSAYEYGPARTIAVYATGSAEISMNANVFATGYAEFGWFGLVGVAVLLGIYLRVLDRAAALLPIWFSSVVVVMPAVALSNTALHTAVLSHGLALALVLLAGIPRERAMSRVRPGGAGANDQAQ